MSGRVLVVGLAVGLAGLLPTAASAATYSTPGTYSVVVPSGVDQVTITATGGSGGSDAPIASASCKPGKGGLVKATYAVSEGSTLHFTVAGAGGSTTGDGGGHSGVGGGGAGGDSPSGHRGGGGGGGGASSVSLEGALLLVAAGGGGCGAYDNNDGIGGGGGTMVPRDRTSTRRRVAEPERRPLAVPGGPGSPQIRLV